MTTTQQEFRSGYIAVVGRPNVGKSTLVNALVGHKISIVTAKPHTTRHAILGVLSLPDAQLIFIDTPGLESRSKRLLNRVMNRAAVGSLETADVVLLVVEAGRWDSGDEEALGLVARSGKPCILAVNKIDQVRPRDKLLPYLAGMANRFDFADIVPVSALKDDNLATLQRQLTSQLPPGEHFFAADIKTDRSLRFRAAEVLREKLMEQLRQEVPYGLGVEIVDLQENDDGRLVIDANIWVDRESHKGIVVGQGGSQIRQIGRAARLELQSVLDRPVHLESHVKVKRNWYDNERALRELGYDADQ